MAYSFLTISSKIFVFDWSILSYKRFPSYSFDCLLTFSQCRDETQLDLCTLESKVFVQWFTNR